MGYALKDTEDPAHDSRHPCEQSADDTDDGKEPEETEKEGGGADDLDAEPGGAPHAVVEEIKMGVAVDVVAHFVGDDGGEDAGRALVEKAGGDGDVPRAEGPGVGKAGFRNGEVVFFLDLFHGHAAFFAEVAERCVDDGFISFVGRE